MTLPHDHDSPLVSRRQLLRSGALSFGSLALAGLSAKQAPAAPATDSAAANPLAPRPPHFVPRAKRVIFLYMWGGPSQMDLFDPKPDLNAMHGKEFKFGGMKRIYKGSPVSFKQHGESGLNFSHLLPRLATQADDMCMLHGMHTDSQSHTNASLLWLTGATNFVRPSVGSWVVYGLGTENESLPGFITIKPMRSLGSRMYSNVFLPAIYQGTPVGHEKTPTEKAQIRNLTNGTYGAKQQRQQLQLIRQLNREFGQQTAADRQAEGMIQSLELAFRMQTSATELFDLSDEPKHMLEMYGADKEPTRDFGQQCLLARRMAESGVRFIQLNHDGWDHHTKIDSGLPEQCAQVDKPITALLKDLKQRGMLEDTLVVFGSEFGRTSFADGKLGPNVGRAHNRHAFTIWMAGGGVRGGMNYGTTDEFGAKGVENRVHVHDLHATLLHLLGLEHKKLTYPYAGRDFRLTDVYGNVVRDILT